MVCLCCMFVLLGVGPCFVVFCLPLIFYKQHSKAVIMLFNRNMLGCPREQKHLVWFNCSFSTDQFDRLF